MRIRDRPDYPRSILVVPRLQVVAYFLSTESLLANRERTATRALFWPLERDENSVRHAFQILIHLGVFGPFLLGIADSSFLFLPFGNDLLVAVLIARNHLLGWEYVPIAALGSVVGIFLLDFVSRKGGEAGLERLTNRKRLQELKRKIDEDAGYAVAIACLAPPPFPFTPVIAAASAFQYPRKKLLSIAFAARIVRFAIVAVLAILFGPEILSVTRTSVFFWAMMGFVLLCVVGSVLSVGSWIRHSRKPTSS